MQLDAAGPCHGPAPTPADLFFMALALEEARLAADAGEVPVGAVITAPAASLSAAGRRPDSLPQAQPGVWLLGRGNNHTRRSSRVHAHAELEALAAAEALLGDYRLEGATCYVTLEPCLMCLGALSQARISRVVYGAPEPKFGALRSRFSLEGHEAFRRMDFCGAVLAEQSQALLAGFFGSLRRTESAPGEQDPQAGEGER